MATLGWVSINPWHGPWYRRQICSHTSPCSAHMSRWRSESPFETAASHSFATTMLKWEGESYGFKLKHNETNEENSLACWVWWKWMCQIKHILGLNIFTVLFKNETTVNIVLPKNIFFYASKTTWNLSTWKFFLLTRFLSPLNSWCLSRGKSCGPEPCIQLFLFVWKWALINFPLCCTHAGVVQQEVEL